MNPRIESTKGIERAAGPAWIKGADWYECAGEGGMTGYLTDKGTLSRDMWVTADFILDIPTTVVFELRLYPEGTEDSFAFIFSLLPYASARLRLPLSATDTSRWLLGREGALLKPMCWGYAVDPESVTRMELKVLRKGPGIVRWCQTPLSITNREPPLIDTPVLPRGKLLDELGQAVFLEWPGKTSDTEALWKRLLGQRAASEASFPPEFSRFGGWAKAKPLEATGFFRTYRDRNRWWLVDPDGYPFWSAGVDCVAPDVTAASAGLEEALSYIPPDDPPYSTALRLDKHGRAGVNYLAANFARVFGEKWRDDWERIVAGFIRSTGFNTVANWSDWEAASRRGLPYVRPLALEPSVTIFRDFPDVFDPSFERDAAEYAGQLEPTKDDPLLVGYFLMNEPNWGFASEVPAEGMLRTNDGCSTRRGLAAFLRERHGTDAGLREAWGMEVTFSEIEGRRFGGERFTAAAREDLSAFSTVMVEKLFTGLTSACRKVDPNHLNLGARYYTVPPSWALAGMKSFDCFSINCYRERIPHEDLALIARTVDKPTMIGEWHFGSLDAGLPATGIGHVPTQEDRGRAYRAYLEDAATDPNCVGVHWFQFYDQSALGRFDGETYNIGFLDVCHRPYRELTAAALETHRSMYRVAAGKRKPFTDAPEYLPRLFV